jgi:glycerol-3-phosphate dehydrogenase
MAQDAVDAAEREANLPRRPCTTENLRLRDETPHVDALDERDRITYFARHEMARTLEDVLARRSRTLFIDAAAAVGAAPSAARLLAEALQRDSSWEGEQLAAFTELAARYRPQGVR